MTSSLELTSVALRSDVGRVRSENQDRCGEFARASGERLVVVADGMGGHRGGATAALITLDTIGEAFGRSEGNVGVALREAIERANQEVWRESATDEELHGMGSTVVAIALGDPTYVAHLGDSRCYRLRDGHLETLTDDHSTVGELVRSGRITEEEAENHPRRNEVLRSVGTPTPAEAEIREIETAPGDCYLLCSDGLSGVVGHDEIARLLAANVGPDAADALIQAAIDAGAPDNVTVAVVELAAPGEAPTHRSDLEDPADAAGSPHAPRSAALRRLSVIAALTTAALILALAIYVASSLLGWGHSEADPGTQPERSVPGRTGATPPITRDAGLS